MKLINIKIEPGRAFDELAILFIKKDNCNDSQKKLELQKQIEELEIAISVGIGQDKAIQIFKSNEYKELKLINNILFEAFNKMNEGKEMSSIAVNKLNFDRYICKKNLQEKHFQVPLSELKIGY